ncbi:carbohydrate ABC transporter substrate-binding protein (CUT1 family) [Streptomyces sp. 846.5]|nr:extracellular solute-binding protein [Streptomyces sp. 846.5]TDT97479.1 carbohydrate ABC transporter substrate-binding protein (CUT1 family) [Streptomyces sp. 846.5]
MGRVAQSRVRTVLAIASAVALSTVAGCSSSGGKAAGGSGGSGGSAAGSAPVTIQYWDDTVGMAAVVDQWNKANPGIQIKYTKVTLGDTGYQKIAAAIKAGNGPCIYHSDAQDLVSFAAQGLVQDISKQAAQYQGVYSAPAWKAVSPGGATYGIPQSASPNFFAYRTDLFKKYGLAVPTTWDQFIADGRKLEAANPKLKLMNYAPEDPSGFVGLNWEAGASWYQQSGDGWKIDFTSPQALKAAGVLQQMVDDHLLSSVSYTDPGIWKTWDDGGTLAMTTSTWQLPIYAKVFPKSDGNWAMATVPQYTAGEASTDSNYSAVAVSKGCTSTEQALKFASWVTQNSTPLTAVANPTTGASYFPALTDISPYVDGITPTTMFKEQTPTETAAVISKAAGEVNPAWQYGPDYAAMYTKMASYWPTVLAGKMTAVQLLQTMQAFVLSDLKSQGINASAA